MSVTLTLRKGSYERRLVIAMERPHAGRRKQGWAFEPTPATPHLSKNIMKKLQNNYSSKNKVTLIGGVHGNEFFGRTVFNYFAKQINKYPGLTLILANTEALNLRRRGIDGDLNRSFPGSIYGNHEEKLAKKLLNTIDSTSYIIDIHTTGNSEGLVPIITNQSKGTKQIINQLQTKNIVYMQSGFGSLISQFKQSISLEYHYEYCRGSQAIEDLEQAIVNLLSSKENKKIQRNIFTCRDRISASVVMPKNAQSFERINSLDIIPFLPRYRARNGYKGFVLSEPEETMI